MPGLYAIYMYVIQYLSKTGTIRNKMILLDSLCVSAVYSLKSIPTVLF